MPEGMPNFTPEQMGQFAEMMKDGKMPMPGMGGMPGMPEGMPNFTPEQMGQFAEMMKNQGGGNTETSNESGPSNATVEDVD